MHYVLLLFLTSLLVYCSRHDEAKRVDPYSDAQNFLVEEELGPTRWDAGDTTITNEARLDLYFPYVQNKRGVYVGVGSIQNFILASWASAEAVFLFDFTKIVVFADRVHVAFFKNALTKEEYLSFFTKPKEEEVVRLLKKEYPAWDEASIQSNFRLVAQYFRDYLAKFQKLQQNYPYGVYFTVDEQYLRLRTLALQNRLFVFSADLRGEKALLALANFLKQKSRFVSLLYLSNAEEYFPNYSPSFRRNISELPVEKNALLLRSLAVQKHHYNWAPGSEFLTQVGFHYNVMSLPYFQAQLQQGSQDLSLKKLMVQATFVTKDKSLSEILLPQ
ncbi:MAG: hypothetical protein NZM25_02430 [Leptospiraceae bacterium]|nr:hypothetical protein [Leptospiraceae bacterium]MDW8307674.1 hypothetical protein [Leptospiraceae bacterium]